MRISCARAWRSNKATPHVPPRRSLGGHSFFPALKGNSTQSTSRIRHPPCACSPLRSEAAGRS